MKKTKYLTENEFRHLIRARVLTELKKLEQNSPMNMIDYAYSPENRCIEFESAPEALNFILKNGFDENMSISHSLFGDAKGNIYAWRREVEDFIEKTGANPRSFVPYWKKGFMKIADNDTLLKFLQFIQEKYGNLSLYTPNGPDDLKYFKY